MSLCMRLLDGMPGFSTLPPVALIAKCSKIGLHGRTVIGKRHYVVDVKDRSRVDRRRPTAENAPKLVPREHAEAQFQRNGSVLLSRELHRLTGRRINGRQRDVVVSANQRGAGIDPSSKALLVGRIRVCRVRCLPLEL